MSDENRNDRSADLGDWQVSSEVTRTVDQQSARCLEAYGVNPDLIEEHFGIERGIAEGGYGRRQIYELVQNGADAILGSSGRIEVVLSKEALYCANEGLSVDPDGVRAILGAHRSAKRGSEIGRFGVGFKSVLAVSTAPQFFSRSGSFVFDPGRSHELISEITGEADRLPSLRLGFPVNPSIEATRDPLLEELMQWATTVVRLPLDAQMPFSNLVDDLGEFPPEFALFSPHVASLRLRNLETGFERLVQSRKGADQEVLLEVDGTVQSWTVIEGMYKMSAAARAAAGELADRDELPLVWAVPRTGRSKRGSFWAFFPTEYRTSLSGILNAPWKTNVDRQNLLSSAFNDEMLEYAAGVVVDALPLLSSETDPASHLECMPATSIDLTQQWADKTIAETVLDFAIDAAIFPDLDGELRLAGNLRLSPSKITAEAQAIFAAVCPERSWVHPSIDAGSGGQRRAVAERVLGSKPVTIGEWLASLVSEKDPRASAAAIRIVKILALAEISGWEDSEVVLTMEGNLARLDPATLFLGNGQSTSDTASFIDGEVLQVDGVVEDLRALGVREFDEVGRLQALAAGGDTEQQAFWSHFWPIARAIDRQKVAEVVEEHIESSSIRAMDREGQFARREKLTVPGEVLSADDSENPGFIVDMEYHKDDAELLELFGFSQCPSSGCSPDRESWWRDYHNEALSRFYFQCRPRNPRRDLLEVSGRGYVGPSAPVNGLGKSANADYCASLLKEPEQLVPWSCRHTTQDYEPVEQPNPTLWMIKNNGWLHSSRGVARASYAVGPGLKQHGEYLHVVDVPSHVAQQLELAMTEDELTVSQVKAAVEHASGLGSRRFGGALSMALRVGIPAIATIPHRSTGAPIELSEVVACVSQDVEAISQTGCRYAVLESEEEISTLVSDWGMRSVDDLFSVVVQPKGATDQWRSTEMFPLLAAFGVDLDVIICDELEVHRVSESGRVVDRRTSWQEGNKLFVGFEEGHQADLLDAVLEAANLDLNETERMSILQDNDRKESIEVRNTVAGESTIEKKLVAALGHDALRRGLPVDLLDELKARGDVLHGERLAQLSLAVHGVEVLQQHKEELSKRGLNPPSRWSGSNGARRFCVDLGLPDEFAGFPKPSRDALVKVEGPPQMPPLHRFQRESADLIREVLRKRRGRGLLSLPTGAGKTRTAVHAFIESMREGEFEGPLLWVAQTDELCEQAVAAWSENWRASGPRDTLKIGRLWSSNEVEDLNDPHQVVVATIAKLSVCFKKKEYQWLSQAKGVVIDEAHRAISPAYTELLEWLGMQRNVERIPVVGLSATPYRGTSEEQTQRLVTRFGGHRFDRVGDDPYRVLQDMGVLSEVDHELLAGAQVKLSSSELDHLEKFRNMPPSVLARIGEDKGRNESIVQSISALQSDETVLLFAASVPHAELLAGWLSAEQIPARSISANTDRGARRHYIEQFRQGDIRVLTNFGVLTEGFDAPAVSAVYLARPTYSPNLYQQMIGRGLRGPLNGGRERCTVVNVEDNLAQYGVSLAFHEFEPLWSGKAAADE